MTWMTYRDGDLILAVHVGMPEESTRIGVGRTIGEAVRAAEGTPIPSAGSAGSAGRTIAWARAQGWEIGEDPEPLPPQADAEATRIADEAAREAEGGGRGAYTVLAHADTGSRMLIRVRDDVWQTPVDSPLDIHGIPVGCRWECSWDHYQRSVGRDGIYDAPTGWIRVAEGGAS